MITKVEFTCPECGTTWTEYQDPSDDWFNLATRQTLCANCGKVVLERIAGSGKMNEKNECKCWSEVSLLNDQDNFSPYQLFLYNMTQDDLAFISIRDKETNKIYNTMYIHYCPLCGRFLK